MYAGLIPVPLLVTVPRASFIGPDLAKLEQKHRHELLQQVCEILGRWNVSQSSSNLIDRCADVQTHHLGVQSLVNKNCPNFILAADQSQ